MKTTATTLVKRSWADIVKGNDEPSASPDLPVAEEAFPTDEELPTVASDQALQPAQRGTWQCHCRGEVLVMLGHYGWIMPFDEVDHPDVGKTRGRIYVHRRDIMDGDVVSFYLYSDQQGVGAEYCQLEECTASYFRAGPDRRQEFASNRTTTFFRPEATEFVPGAAHFSSQESEYALAASVPGCGLEAADAAPAALMAGVGDTTTCFRAEAAEFVPGAPAAGAVASGVQVPEASVFSINPAFLSDDESDDEPIAVNDADVSSNDGDQESICDESNQSSADGGEVDRDNDDDLVVLRVPLRSKCGSSDGSTSVGACSDSEPEGAAPVARTPPGLKLPAGWRPPPGLSLE